MARFFVRFFPIFLALFLAAAIFLFRINAHAAEQIGSVCQSLGVSTMAQDRKNLIVCLEDDAGALVWKSMTSKPVTSIPVGAIIAWPLAKNPKDMQNADGTFNWLDCNGQTVPASLYPDLYALIGAKVPDLRGLFLRGLGGNSASLGAQQGDAIRNITGGIAAPRLASGGGSWGAFSSYQNGSQEAEYNGWYYGHGVTFDVSRVVPTAEENRPTNMAVRYLIRARP